MQVNAIGLSCPEPVLLLRKALADRPDTLDILVDNAAARGNCTRLAAHSGYTVTERTEGPVWVLSLTKA